MSEPDVSRIQGVDLLASRDSPGCGMPGHAAVVTDPVDRADRALRLVFVRGCEAGRAGPEIELEEVDPVSKTR
jgi:hypothetical protein